MNFILYDTKARRRLFPLTTTRAVADIRMGILTIKERWEKMTGARVFVLTEEYLLPLYEAIPADDYVFIDACIIPSYELIQRINNLPEGEGIRDKNGLIAGKASIDTFPSIHGVSALFNEVSSVTAVKRLMFPYQIFQWNEEMIQLDFKLLTKGRISNNLNDSVHVTRSSQIFIEDGAQISYTNLNASSGPIYIGKDTTIMEGCFIRGPFSLGEGAVLKMGSKIYGATTIGPYCTAGGEIKNSVMSGYSNKAHDGYLGDSVIGEWCNLGAGTSNSNVKNTGGEVNAWNYYENSYVPAGIKCGVIMGDYSRTSINTSINTGTVIGVCCNVFGEGLTPKFINDFSWGADGQNQYEFEKAVKDISNWKKMKNKILREPETKILKHIFENYTK
ncbi:putative sugar nucleotidyl transferase [Segetibacter koreensis]|uniref:putative sugar nucleotidyl transferase n=1 Tax=Segetibacter koreensis TaxID=398037 RepID=UPI000366F2EF|nr:putative sugar nucleotidyl transferase [Segetibacter koreensis]